MGGFLFFNRQKEEKRLGETKAQRKAGSGSHVFRQAHPPNQRSGTLNDDYDELQPGKVRISEKSLRNFNRRADQERSTSDDEGGTAWIVTAGSLEF